MSGDTDNQLAIDAVGYVAGFFAAIITMPQIYKIIKLKKADDLSIWMIILLALTSSLYIFYGILIKSTPLVVTDSLALLLDIILLILKIAFDMRNKNNDQDGSDHTADS